MNKKQEQKQEKETNYLICPYCNKKLQEDDHIYVDPFMGCKYCKKVLGSVW